MRDQERRQIMAKYTALDIANLFIDLANSIPNDSIDNAKVNKLCYYAQGWSFTKLGYPLFGDTVEAWEYGPLIQSVYYAYKPYERNPIKEPTYHFDESRLTSAELTLLTDVYITYGKYSSKELINRTHAPDSPWSSVYERMQNNPITEDYMRKYFEGSDELETMHLRLTPENVLNYE